MTPISEHKNNILPLEATFPHQLNSLLLNNNFAYRVSNLGIVGASSTCTLNVLKYFDLVNSKIIVVHNGYNDLPIFKIKDSTAYFLKTDNKNGFCMYNSNSEKRIYDIKRILSHNFPLISGFLNKSLVNGDRDVYLGYELTNNDLFAAVPINQINNYSLKHEATFLHTNKLIVDYAKNNGLKVLFIIEPIIEENFNPNGSSFRYENSTTYLKKIHYNQQNSLKEFIKKIDDKDIKYLDVRPIYSKNHKFFYDEIHLNSDGNKLLSQLIFGYLSKLNWLN